MFDKIEFDTLQCILTDLRKGGAVNPCVAGGYLRDTFLGRTKKDIDIFYQGHPEIGWQGSIPGLQHIKDICGKLEKVASEVSDYEGTEIQFIETYKAPVIFDNIP